MVNLLIISPAFFEAFYVLCQWEYTLHTPRSDTHIHGISSGRLLDSVTFSKTPEQRVGKSIFRQVAKILILNLVCGVVGRSNDGLGREGINSDWLVGLRVDELVVHDLHRRILRLELHDLVGDGGGVCERWDILADTSEAQDEVLWVRTRQLGFALLTDDGDIGVWVVGEEPARSTRHARVHTTAETLVGAEDDEKRLLVIALQRLRLRLLEHLVGGLTVDAGGCHGLLGAGELGGGDNLHRLGDLLDVLNRLETTLDLLERGIVGGLLDGGGPVAQEDDVSTCCVAVVMGMRCASVFFRSSSSSSVLGSGMCVPSGQLNASP